MKWLDKVKEEKEITADLGWATILDAIWTSANFSKPEIHELNPSIQPLIEGFGFLEHTLMLSVTPIPFYILLYHLWATPSTKNTGLYTITGIIISKSLAATNNMLLHEDIFVPGIITIPIILAPVIIMPGYGVSKDLKQN